MKMTMEKRLEIAKEYFSDKTSITKLAKKYDTEKGKVQYYVRLYELHGEKPFSEDQMFRLYTREEKLEAIKEVLSGKKSARQVALEHALPNPHTMQDWVKMYLERGVDAIQDSKGRKQYMLHEDRQKYLANKELKERLEYLEAENAYLKKLYSLRQKKNKQLKKK